VAKVGRPRKPIDLERVEALAKIGATQEEIASDLGISVDTLQRRKNFAAVYKSGMDQGRMSLRHKQFNLAMAGDKTMLVWLGKQLLGQTDKREVTSDVTHRSTTELIEAARNGGFAPEGHE